MGSKIDGGKRNGMQGRKFTAEAAEAVVHRNSIRESLSCSPTHGFISTPPPNMTEEAQKFLLQSNNGVVDSSKNHIYISPIAPHGPPNTTTPKISVGTANGHVERLLATASFPTPQLEADFPTTGYIIPSFTNTIVGVGPIWDADCTVLFAKHDVTVFSPGGKPILTGWREKGIPKLWRFSLIPNNEPLLRQTP